MAVELKSRVQHVRDIVEQLQAGADLLSRHPARSFAAVLVFQKAGSSIEVRQLRGAHVWYAGKKYPIVRHKTPCDLSRL